MTQKLDNCFQYYYYKQIIDNKEEVYKLKECFIDLGKPIETPTEDYISSDEEFKYFDRHSDTESYDSEYNGFHLIVDEYNRRINLKTDKIQDISSENPVTKKTKKMPKKRSNKTKRGSRDSRGSGGSRDNKTPEIKIEIKPQEMEITEDYVPNMGEESLLEDDFYETNMQFFLSQSLPLTQSSALIQQNGRFAYYQSNDSKDMTIKVEQNVDYLLIPLTDLVEDSNCWPLLLKTMIEDLFAFRKSSKYSKYLAHKLLSHYNWSEDKHEISDSDELSYFKGLHIQFLDTFIRDILLNCYSRDSIMEVISGSSDETNTWPFILKLITYLVNETIRKTDFSLALLHFKLIVEVFVKDFQQFLNDSKDYCVDIQRIEKHENFRPLICRLIWSQKSPNYLNTVFKQIIFLITKVIKIKNDSLLIELFKLFELSAECLRIGSGNVRPYITFAFNKPTPITELFQQMNYYSLATNEVFDKLLKVSNVCWIRLQLCGHFMTQFIVDLKTKYLTERHRRISLKLIVECLTNAKPLTKTSVKPSSSQTSTDSQSRASTSGDSPRKRSSLGLVNQNRKLSNKEWSKKNKYGENALHTTCIKGQTDRLIEILQLSVEGFGPDPNDTDNAGYTPLSEAVIHSHTDCIRALIEWQNQSNKRLDFEAGPEKQTALHEAIENNAIDCAKLIIESGGLELLDIKRVFDDKTPKDLIKSEEMREMIESMSSKTCSTSFRPKINIKSVDDSRVFIQILISLIVSYIETTKMNSFLETYSEDNTGQESWPDIFFNIFERDISETDVSLLIEDLTVIRKLPKIIESLKTLFDSSTLPLIQDLELTLSLLTLNI